MLSRDFQKQALLPPPLTMATGNLVNLEKTSKMELKTNSWLATQSKIFINLGRKLKKVSI